MNKRPSCNAMSATVQPIYRPSKQLKFAVITEFGVTVKTDNTFL